MEKHKWLRSFNVSFKLDDVKFAEENSKEGAARAFGVDPKWIHEWCSQNPKLQELSSNGGTKCKHLDGAGHRQFDKEMEVELFEWIMELCCKNLSFSRWMIATKAKDMGDTGDFRASCGWLQCFLLFTLLIDTCGSAHYVIHTKIEPASCRRRPRLAAVDWKHLRELAAQAGKRGNTVI